MRPVLDCSRQALQSQEAGYYFQVSRAPWGHVPILRPWNRNGHHISWFGQPLKKYCLGTAEILSAAFCYWATPVIFLVAESALNYERLPILCPLKMNVHPISWFGQPLKKPLSHTRALQGRLFTCTAGLVPVSDQVCTCKECTNKMCTYKVCTNKVCTYKVCTYKGRTYCELRVYIFYLNIWAENSGL
jgi:hypothetical protein